jgi:hypothetical protein
MIATFNAGEIFGSGSVFYTLKDGAGADIIARTSSGVTETSGVYSAVISDALLSVDSVIFWDVAGEIVAVESFSRVIDPITVEEIDQALTASHGEGDWTTGTGGGAVVDVASIWSYTPRTLTESLLTEKVDAIKNKTDVIPTTSEISSAVWTNSNRELTSSLDSSVIAAIKAKTDNLPAAPASVSDVPTTGEIWASSSCPTPEENAAVVWSAAARTLTAGTRDAVIDSIALDLDDVVRNTNNIPTDAAGVSDLEPLQSAIDAIAERLEEQVPTGGVVVLPQPQAGSTVAWVVAVDETGALEADVDFELYLSAVKGDGTGYTSDVQEATSDAEGLVTFTIPRGEHLSFRCRRSGGEWISFYGDDADVLEMPAMIGKTTA